MAIILRIISADKSKVVTKKLPALPSEVHVPEGATVEVVDQETHEVMSLSQYINAHASTAGEYGSTGLDGVRIVTVVDWGDTVDWLDTLDSMAEGPLSTTAWYNPNEDRYDTGTVFGFDQETLLLGGAVGAGIVLGAVALDGSGPKDKTAPVAPTNLDLAADDDDGSSNIDNVTTKNTGLTFSGTAEAGSRVELFDGMTSLGTTITDDQGVFTIDVDLSEDVHLISAQATDNAGNTSVSSVPITVRVDSTAPAAPSSVDLAAEDDTGASGTDNVTSRTTALSITGTVEPLANVTIFEGSTILGSGRATASGTFSIDISLAEGIHSVAARASDAAGNTSDASAAVTITIDTTVAAAPTGLDLDPSDDDGESSNDNVTSQTQDLTFSGMAEAGSTVDLFDGTTLVGTTTAGSNGIFQLDLDLDVGTHIISARATDLSGNFGPTSDGLAIVIEAAAQALTSPDQDLLLGSNVTPMA